MKKLAALLTTLVMMLATAAPAFAETCPGGAGACVDADASVSAEVTVGDGE